MATPHIPIGNDSTMNSEIDYAKYWRLRGSVTEWSDVFTKEAMASIFEHSEGIGRLVNALCDQCLFAGAIKGAAQIEDRLVPRVGQVI